MGKWVAELWASGVGSWGGQINEVRAYRHCNKQLLEVMSVAAINNRGHHEEDSPYDGSDHSRSGNNS